MKTALAIRHVAFEDLGSLAPIMADHGYEVHYVDYGVDDFAAIQPLACDLALIMGGPIGAYEEASYPALRQELAFIERRLQAGRPLIGICLGAQLMARALGARVYPGEHKEIGWKPIALTAAGRNSCLRSLGSEDIAVLHWHGDTLDLPRGATLLASSDLYANQAFAWGSNALALQFHLEISAAQLERWYVGHACELAAAGISVPALRADSARYAPALAAPARECFVRWLSQIRAR